MALDYEGVKAFAAPLFQPIFIPILYWSLQSIGVAINLWESGDRTQDKNDFQNLLYPKQYDFIIVGGGSAGSLVANRLSREYKVLLLEAGGEPNPLQYVPGFNLFLLNQPHIDWSYRTVPQKHSSLMSLNHESSWSAGRGLGGSGTLNRMVYLRGHKKDYDQWANITGDERWSWEHVLPYFRNLEDYEMSGDEVNHGYKGELRISASEYTGTASLFMEAGLELGYPNVDMNGPFKEGFDFIRYPMKNGRAFGPYNAYLEPIRSRSSLTIMKFAHVNKILFENGNMAYGVEYDRHGRTFVAHASKEVIICAGTVSSAKLLMLSGIGPPYHLNDLNIPVISSLPVGQSLQDHLGVYLGPFFIKEGMGTHFDRDLTPSQFVKWFTSGGGRLSSSGFEAVGAFSSQFAKARHEADWPDIALFSFSFTNFRLGTETFARAFNLKFDELHKYFDDNDMGKDSMYVIVQGSRPISRGRIHLASTSPYDKPIIDPNYLGDEDQLDLKVLVEGIRKTMFLMENSTSMGGKAAARFTGKKVSGCDHIPFRTDPYWKCFIRRFSVSQHHYVGTASMGSVVDSKLRVIGTKRLRVIDASVIPAIPHTNTQATTLMLADKGSDMILKYWNEDKLFQPEDVKPLIPSSLYEDEKRNSIELFAHETNLVWNSEKLKPHKVNESDLVVIAHPEETISDTHNEDTLSIISANSIVETPRPRSRNRKKKKMKAELVDFDEELKYFQEMSDNFKEGLMQLLTTENYEAVYQVPPQHKRKRCKKRRKGMKKLLPSLELQLR